MARFSEKTHVLVIDDDRRICDLVSRYLWAHDFIAVAAHSAGQARALMTRFEFDALVVDVMMPEETGLDFVRTLQTGDQDIPVLFLTALSGAEDRIAGLETGADDYLTKPFEPRELVLRLKSIVRRRGTPQANTTPSYKIGPWTFDPVYHELRREDDTVALTDVETTLLKALCMQGNALISREDLSRACSVDPDTRNLDVQVARLRRKIEENTQNPRYLKTIRGKGYMLRVDVL